MTAREIEEAIQSAFDGNLDEDACRKLREELKTNHSARALYFQHASLHQVLCYRFSRPQRFETARSLGDSRFKFQIRHHARSSLAIAALLMLVLGLSLKLVLSSDRAALASFEVAAGSQFSVKQSASDSATSQPNELREGAQVRLEQGSLEVLIRKGSRAVILAPASFRIDSEKRMVLDEGTAWFEIGKDARDFQVVTRQMTVTDLGTQFGVVAHPDSSHEVHVFSGRVIARAHAALRTEEPLTTGMARLCDPVGRLKPVGLRPETFHTSLPKRSDSGLIVNGDFETGNPPPAQTYGVPATAALLPGWRFGSAITVVHATSEGRPGYGEKDTTIVSSTADTQVGFNSDSDTRPAAESVSLYQTFATTPGREYEIQFEMGAIFFQPESMEITASTYDGGAVSRLLSVPALGSRIESRDSTAGNGYNPPVKFTFTATSGTATLVFTETSASSISADPVIDNISVVEK